MLSRSWWILSLMVEIQWKMWIYLIVACTPSISLLLIFPKQKRKNTNIWIQYRHKSINEIFQPSGIYVTSDKMEFNDWLLFSSKNLPNSRLYLIVFWTVLILSKTVQYNNAYFPVKLFLFPYMSISSASALSSPRIYPEGLHVHLRFPWQCHELVIFFVTSFFLNAGIQLNQLSQVLYFCKVEFKLLNLKTLMPKMILWSTNTCLWCFSFIPSVLTTSTSLKCHLLLSPIMVLRPSAVETLLMINPQSLHSPKMQK